MLNSSSSSRPRFSLIAGPAVLLLGVAVGLRLVQVDQHRRVEDHRLEHVAELAEGVLADHVTVVRGGQQPGLVPDRHVHVRGPDVVHLLEQLVDAPDGPDDLHLDQLVLGGHVVELLVVRLVVVGVEELLELGRAHPQQRVAVADRVDHRVGPHAQLLVQVGVPAHGLELAQRRRADPVRQPAGPVQVLVEGEDGRPLQQRLLGHARRLGRPVAGLVVRLGARLVRGRRGDAGDAGGEPDRLGRRSLRGPCRRPAGVAVRTCSRRPRPRRCTPPRPRRRRACRAGVGG